MKQVISTFGTKRQFLDAGLDAEVTFLDSNDKPVTKTLAQVGPCCVLNAVPVPQGDGIRWDHKETLKKNEATQRQLHSRLQPSWTAKFDGSKVW